MNIKEIFEQVRRVALYQDPKYGSVFVGSYFGDTDHQYHSGDVRISPPVEVHFDQLPHEEIVQTAVAALDAAELRVRTEMQSQIDDIRARKQQLLAITFEPEVVS